MVAAILIVMELDNLKTELLLLKSMKQSEVDEIYCQLMNKAKDCLGELSPHMAHFYFEYGNFLLTQMENSLETVNAQALAQGKEKEVKELPNIQEGYECSESEDSGHKSEDNILYDAQQE